MIRNFHDSHIRDPTFFKFRWNIVTYSLYQGNMRIFDWLLANFDCSLQDALRDEGNSSDVQCTINGRTFSSFGIYSCMLRKRKKRGLVHLARYYPTAFELSDFEPVIMTLLEQHDYESLEVLGTPAFQGMFNILTLEQGQAIIERCVRMLWVELNKPSPKLSKFDLMSNEELQALRNKEKKA